MSRRRAVARLTRVSQTPESTTDLGRKHSVWGRAGVRRRGRRRRSSRRRSPTPIAADSSRHWRWASGRPTAATAIGTAPTAVASTGSHHPLRAATATTVTPTTGREHDREQQRQQPAGDCVRCRLVVPAHERRRRPQGEDEAGADLHRRRADVEQRRAVAWRRRRGRSAPRRGRRRSRMRSPRDAVRRTVGALRHVEGGEHGGDGDDPVHGDSPADSRQRRAAPTRRAADRPSG